MPYRRPARAPRDPARLVAERLGFQMAAETKPEPSRGGTPTAPPKPAQRLYTANIQNDWYERNAAHPVSVRLMDGTNLVGMLAGYDTYTIALRVANREEPVLISKHAIAFCVRREGDGKEK